MIISAVCKSVLRRSLGVSLAKGAVLALVLTATVVFGAAIMGSAAAQTGVRGDPEWVNPDVIALRDEVELLRREVARLQAGVAVNGEVPIGASGAAPSGDFFIRLDQLETEARRLIGEMERLSFETERALRERDAQIAELYARVAAVEAAAGVTPPASSAPPPGSGAGISAPTSGGAIGGGVAAAGSPGAAGAQGSPTQPGQLGELTSTAPAGAVSDSPIFETPGASGESQAAVVAPVADGSGQPAAPAVELTEPVTYEAALEYLRARDLDRAEAAFAAFIAGNPSDPRIGEATYWLGETYYVRGRYDQAARQFLTSFREHPTGRKAPDSLFRLGVTLAQLGQRDEACASFEQVSVRYPDAPATLLRRADVESKRAGCS